MNVFLSSTLPKETHKCVCPVEQFKSYSVAYPLSIPELSTFVEMSVPLLTMRKLTQHAYKGHEGTRDTT